MMRQGRGSKITTSRGRTRPLDMRHRRRFAAERHERAVRRIATQFLRNLAATVPYAIHTVLIDNGIQAYNCERRLKTLRNLSPCEYICKCRAGEPRGLAPNPHHHMPGPNT